MTTGGFGHLGRKSRSAQLGRMAELRQGRLARRRIAERITLLCESGVGIEAMAPALSAALRDLVEADAASIFWLGEDGNAGGFFHDAAPAEVKETFINQFDELFSRNGEANMMTMLQPDGPSIGRLLQDDMLMWFWNSNVYRHLCVPLGHRYPLDARYDVDGRGKAVLLLWNKEGGAFGHRHADLLGSVHQLIENALANTHVEPRWETAGSRITHLLTDLTGSELLSIDATAERLLKESHLLRQNITMTAAMGHPPAFVRQLADMVARGHPARLQIPVPHGRLVAQATLSHRRNVDAPDSDRLFVSLDFETAREIRQVEFVSTAPLTLLQKRIALFAMTGRSRKECAPYFGLSEAALKKHLNTIYGELDLKGWNDLDPRIVGCGRNGEALGAGRP